MKWEYLELTSPTIEQLNNVGQHGWELLFIVVDKYILKRPSD